MSQSQTNKIIGLKRQIAVLKKRLASGDVRPKAKGRKLATNEDALRDALAFAIEGRYRIGQTFLYAHRGEVINWLVIGHPYGDGIYLEQIQREAVEPWWGGDIDEVLARPEVARPWRRAYGGTIPRPRQGGEVVDAPDPNDAELIPAAAYRHIPDPRDIDVDLAEDAGR